MTQQNTSGLADLLSSHLSTTSRKITAALLAATLGLGYCVSQDVEQEKEKKAQQSSYNIERANEAFFKGKELTDNQDYMNAIPYFSQALLDNPKDAHAYFHRARAHIGRNDYTNALKDLKEVRKLKPEWTCSYITRGWIFERQEEFTAAINNYGQVIEQNPLHARARKSRARSYIKRDLLLFPDYQKAREDIEEVIRSNPKDGEAHYLLGLVEQHDENKTKAQEAFALAKMLGYEN